MACGMASGPVRGQRPTAAADRTSGCSGILKHQPELTWAFQPDQHLLLSTCLPLCPPAAIATEQLYFKYDVLNMGYLRMAPRVAVTWQLARQICQCQGVGWDLPVITDKAEQMFIEGRWGGRGAWGLLLGALGPGTCCWASWGRCCSAGGHVHTIST